MTISVCTKNYKCNFVKEKYVKCLFEVLQITAEFKTTFQFNQ